MAENKVARSLHDVGLGAWFGGALMGAVGVNGAAGEVSDPSERARVANAGWARWRPVNLLAVGVHTLGGLQLARGNRGRVIGQQGVASATGLKALLTAAALGASAWSAALGRRMEQMGDVPVESGAVPNESTPGSFRAMQQQQRVLQWAVPALTGSLLVMNAVMGEQQRPSEVAKGMARRLVPGLD